MTPQELDELLGNLKIATAEVERRLPSNLIKNNSEVFFFLTLKFIFFYLEYLK